MNNNSWEFSKKRRTSDGHYSTICLNRIENHRMELQRIANEIITRLLVIAERSMEFLWENSTREFFLSHFYLFHSSFRLFRTKKRRKKKLKYLAIPIADRTEWYCVSTVDNANDDLSEIIEKRRSTFWYAIQCYTQNTDTNYDRISNIKFYYCFVCIR